MTRWRLKKDPVTDAVAIYSVPSRTSPDNAPLSDPWNNKGRLQLHTDAILPSTGGVQQVTINLPAVSGRFFGPSCRINLFAHGLGAACMVEGRILNLNGPGSHVAFAGSVPVNVQANGFATWLTLGSDATNVFVEYFGIGSFSAQSFDLEVSAYDFLATGPAPTSNPALPGFRHYPGSHTILARGAIDTRRRYVRATGAGDAFAIPVNETLKIVGRGIGDDPGSNPSYVQNEIGWRWRYSVDGYVRQTTQAWNGSATDGGTHNATVLKVRL